VTATPSSRADATELSSAAGPPAPSPRTRQWAWLAGWTLLTVAAAFAVWAGAGYWQATRSAPVTLGQARDQVLQAARQEIADLNTVQPRRIGTWQARWLADTTGAEHLRVQQTNPAARAQIEKVKTSSTATVTAIAVTRLDDSAGTAQVIATVQVRQTAPSGATDAISNRYLAGLTRTASGWKISSLTAG
jgi:Mce-associated membrane protein